MSLKKCAFFLYGFAVLTLACDTKTKAVDSCGDGFLDHGEACDGSDLSVESCAELGYHGNLPVWGMA